MASRSQPVADYLAERGLQFIGVKDPPSPNWLQAAGLLADHYDLLRRVLDAILRRNLSRRGFETIRVRFPSAEEARKAAEILRLLVELGVLSAADLLQATEIRFRFARTTGLGFFQRRLLMCAALYIGARAVGQQGTVCRGLRFLDGFGREWWIPVFTLRGRTAVAIAPMDAPATDTLPQVAAGAERAGLSPKQLVLLSHCEQEAAALLATADLVGAFTICLPGELEKVLRSVLGDKEGQPRRVLPRLVRDIAAASFWSRSAAWRSMLLGWMPHEARQEAAPSSCSDLPRPKVQDSMQHALPETMPPARQPDARCPAAARGGGSPRSACARDQASPRRSKGRSRKKTASSRPAAARSNSAAAPVPAQLPVSSWLPEAADARAASASLSVTEWFGRLGFRIIGDADFSSVPAPFLEAARLMANNCFDLPRFCLEPRSSERVRLIGGGPSAEKMVESVVTILRPLGVRLERTHRGISVTANSFGGKHECRRFFTGGWLELFAYDVAREVFKKRGVTAELFWGLQIGSGSRAYELDVFAFWGSGALIIEAKTGTAPSSRLQKASVALRIPPERAILLHIRPNGPSFCQGGVTRCQPAYLASAVENALLTDTVQC